MTRYAPTAIAVAVLFVMPVLGRLLQLRIPLTVVPLLAIGGFLRMVLPAGSGWAFNRPASPHDIVLPSTAGWLVGGVGVLALVFGVNWLLVRVFSARG